MDVLQPTGKHTISPPLPVGKLRLSVAKPTRSIVGIRTSLSSLRMGQQVETEVGKKEWNAGEEMGPGTGSGATERNEQTRHGK